MKKLTFILFSLIAASAMAQTRALITRADRAFDAKDYVTAAYYYSKGLQNGTTSNQGTVPYFSVRPGKRQNLMQTGYLDYRLAESYRLDHNYTLAQQYYGLVVEKYETEYPLARFWYATCLRANNRIDDAINNLQLFINTSKNKSDTDVAQKELKNCLFAKAQIQEPITANAQQLTGNISSNGSDFALSINNGKYWFSSSRTAAGESKQVNHIYTILPDKVAKPLRVDLTLDKRRGLHYGTPALDVSGKRMYLTIWADEMHTTGACIYLSRFSNNRWTIPQKLNSFVNAADYNSMQPFVTADGKYLYYASNRKGGQGGTDIWVSELDNDGMPINTLNLGSTVNSADDEQAPYYSELNRSLIYSSKGFVGMGDFDLFESLNNGGRWGTPKNLGYPCNSTRADIYFYPDHNDEHLAYISSDRESDCCLILYSVPYKPIIRQILMTGLVVDSITSKPLAGATLNLSDSLSQQPGKISMTSANGKYSFTVPEKGVYSIKAQKEGYYIKTMTLPEFKNLKNDTIPIPVIRLKRYPPKLVIVNSSGLVIDCSTNKPLAGVTVTLNDSTSRQTITTFITDATGTYNFTLQANRLYVLKLEKEGYFIKAITLSTPKTILKDTMDNPVVCLQEYEVDKPIVIDNILYDFNKAVLKPEAKIVLDGLVSILHDNPKIKVELSAHTDSFGPDQTNNVLSQKRAQSCVDYIISKGISRSRITAKGYGKTRPIQPNSFDDGRDNPAGRRQNRRTEFKVLSEK